MLAAHTGLAAARHVLPTLGDIETGHRLWYRPVIGEAGGERVDLRPATPADRELLYRVYAATRANELAAVDWPETAVDAFLRQQFDAQDQHYRLNYPGATFEVIVVDGEPAGRLYLHVKAEETRVIDIALLPRFRGHGVGSRLMEEVLAAAADRGLCVTIHVERNNPALAWYHRLGFAMAEDRGVYLFLRCWP
jgi:ribosomal protein S18 acetylase RimI-like enzyme